MSQGYPSANPAGLGSFGGMLHEVLAKYVQNHLDDCLPARVESYDRRRNVATVRPEIQALTSAGETVTRAAVASVPVLALGCGRFFMNFPLRPGDKGWIKANDRDISLFKQAMAESKPNTLRRHSFEDGLFIPDILRNYTIDDEDYDANAVFQHRDGKIRVAVWEDRVKITADKTYIVVRDDGNVEIIAPEKATVETKRLEVRASDSVLLDTPYTEITGIFTSGTKIDDGGNDVSTINGTLRTTGQMHAEDDVISNYGGKNVSGKNHVHVGVQPGPSTTGVPQG